MTQTDSIRAHQLAFRRLPQPASIPSPLPQATPEARAMVCRVCGVRYGPSEVPADGYCKQDVNTQDCGVYVQCFGRLVPEPEHVPPDSHEARRAAAERWAERQGEGFVTESDK